MGVVSYTPPRRGRWHRAKAMVPIIVLGLASAAMLTYDWDRKSVSAMGVSEAVGTLRLSSDEGDRVGAIMRLCEEGRRIVSSLRAESTDGTALSKDQAARALASLRRALEEPK